MASGAGRYAPSPSGPLHLGNLRTALLAWLSARARGAAFVLRIDDLDQGRCRAEHEAGQLADLAALGITFDGEPVRQSTRASHYANAVSSLQAQGLIYSCWCTRADLRGAASAAHTGPLHHAPGTCEPTDRPAALRINAGAATIAFTDRHRGPQRGAVEDAVLQRGDGTYAYHLATVVDDHHQGVTEVVRGEDLLGATATQLWLIDHLGLTAPEYAHVPMVLNAAGQRLAKRGGAVTLADRIALGETPEHVVGMLAGSVGLAAPGEAITATELLARYDPGTFAPPPSGPLPS